jgi:hypothetical protein
MLKFKTLNNIYFKIFFFILIIISLSLYLSFRGVISFTHGPLYYYLAEGMYDHKEFTSTIFAIPTNLFVHPQMGIIFIHYFGILIFGKKNFFLFYIILSSFLWLYVFYNLYKKKEFKIFTKHEKIILFLLIFLQPYNINQLSNFSNESIYLPALILSFFFFLDFLQGDKNKIKILFILIFFFLGSFFRIHNIVFLISLIFFLLVLKKYKLFLNSILFFILFLIFKIFIIWNFFPSVADNLISWFKSYIDTLTFINLNEYSRESNWSISNTFSFNNLLVKFNNGSSIFTFFLFLKKFFANYQFIICLINLFFIFIFLKSSYIVSNKISKNFNLLSIIFIFFSFSFLFLLPIFEFSYLLPTSFIIIIYFFLFIKVFFRFNILKLFYLAASIYSIFIIIIFLIIRTPNIESYYYRDTYYELKNIVKNVDKNTTLFYINFENLTMPEFYRWIFDDKICNYQMNSDECSKLTNKEKIINIIIKDLSNDSYVDIKSLSYIVNIDSYKINKIGTYIILEKLKY